MSEDDKPVFVPTQYSEPDTQHTLNELRQQNNYLEKELEREEQKHLRISAILSQRQRATQRLQTQVNLIRGSNQGYLLYLEQFRARSQPVWWYLAVIFSVICVFGTWDKGAWLAFGANAMAHKLLWRRLYVETNNTPQWIALCIMAYTLVFVK